MYVIFNDLDTFGGRTNGLHFLWNRGGAAWRGPPIVLSWARSRYVKSIAVRKALKYSA